MTVFPQSASLTTDASTRQRFGTKINDKPHLIKEEAGIHVGLNGLLHHNFAVHVSTIKLHGASGLGAIL